MKACIAGLSWVTPLGIDLDDVWAQVERGEAGALKTLTNPGSGRSHSHIPVPLPHVQAVGRHPRLRRSSGISLFAAAAGLAALEHAGLKMTPEVAAQTAVIFAISDGGVLYTRKFYEQIVKQGANSASPLLFPETVYNAPASHLSALLGIDGASYTLVGDAAVGLAALHFAAQLLALGEIEQALVVGAEECDWVLCEAYGDWRLARTPLAEGAAAMLLRRDGPWKLHTHPGAGFACQKESGSALGRVLDDLGGESPELIVSCGNGTFVDRAEATALAARGVKGRTLSPKRSFGEAPGASALLQVVVGALGLERLALSRALVPVVGWNHQTGAVRIER